MNNLKKLITENEKLLDELEFWKSTALELGASEDAYEECLRDVERVCHEMDYDDTGEIHG